MSFDQLTLAESALLDGWRRAQRIGPQLLELGYGQDGYGIAR